MAVIGEVIITIDWLTLGRWRRPVMDRVGRLRVGPGGLVGRWQRVIGIRGAGSPAVGQRARDRHRRGGWRVQSRRRRPCSSWAGGVALGSLALLVVGWSARTALAAEPGCRRGRAGALAPTRHVPDHSIRGDPERGTANPSGSSGTLCTAGSIHRTAPSLKPTLFIHALLRPPGRVCGSRSAVRLWRNPAAAGRQRVRDESDSREDAQVPLAARST